MRAAVLSFFCWEHFQCLETWREESDDFMGGDDLKLLV